MISFINITIFILWFVSAIFDYSEICYIWQLKSYRWDRMRDFLSTKQGKSYWKKLGVLRHFVYIILFFFLQSAFISYFIIFVFALENILFLNNFFKKKIRRPAISPKVSLMFLLALALESFFVFVFFNYLTFLLLLAFRFALFSFVVTVLYILNEILLRYYKYRATEKLKKYSNLTVIGITGSYAKTTVKEFLAQILSKKFKVIKTPANRNTAIAISKFILNNDFSDYDIFIVELGAYKRGDIKFSAEMVKPKIGILTAVNEQHLSLFGSMKNIQNAKFDLLRILPRSGLAVTNSDNKYCREYLHELECEVKTFGVEEKFKPDALGKDVYSDEKGIYVKGIVNNIEGEFFSPVVGEHNASNIVACILVALHLRMDLKDIISAIGKLKMPQGTLETFKYGKSTILDDSYNSNPDGFKSALEALKRFPSHKKRVVITRGMLELGEKAEEIHEKIGGEIAFTADELVLLNRDYEESLRKGVGNKYNTEIIIKDKPEELMSYINSLKNTDAVILLENRLPANVYQKILEDSNQ